MKGTELTLQEYDSKLYDDFERFMSEKGEYIHSYYWRYAKLINDINIIGMTMRKIQVNTKFVNHLQPEVEKMLLAHAQEAEVVLHEDQQDFLADRLEEWKTVKANLQYAKDLLVKFDDCIKNRTVLFGVQIGNWGVMHIKGAFKEDVKPFFKNLRESFKKFEMGLYQEVNEMEAIFKQMEDKVDQCSVKKYFEIEKKQLLINNDRLLDKNISCDIMCTFLRSLNKVDNCGKCQSLEIELSKESNKSFNELTKRFAKLKECFISLELSLKHNKEKIIYDESWKIHDASLINEINNISFEINDLKAQLQDKSIVVNEIQEIKDENVSLAFQVSSLSLLRIESEPINGYFKNNRVVHRYYLKVTKDDVATLEELLDQAKALKPLDKHIGRVSYTDASILKPSNYTRNDRIPQSSCKSKKNKVEAKPRKFKSSSNKNNRVSDCNANVKNVVLSKNYANVCLSCNECLFSANHDAYVVKYLKDVQNHEKAKFVTQKEKIQWKPTGRVFTIVGLKWKLTGRMYNMEGSICLIIKTTPTTIIIEIVLWYLDSGCTKHIIGQRDTLIKFVSKFIGAVRFGNDNFVAIMGYGDLQIGNILISQVYYIKGLGHNLFSVVQLCDSDIEVALRKHTCFVRNLDGVDLLSGSRSSNLYTISLNDMMKSSPICLLSKALKTKSWLWHCRLSHLNFGTINQLAKEGLVKGLPKLKYTRYQLCSAYQMGKSKKG
ncbi:retrovirus-related pol polyprotein from transposon TNT 1-94 [Tanacetum coccineum]